MVSPKPVPPYLRVVDSSACTNGEKSAPARSFGIPIPVSLMAKSKRTVRLVLVDRFHQNRHLPAIGELDGIRHQVAQHLAEPPGIASQQARRIRLHQARQFQPFAIGRIASISTTPSNTATQAEIQALERYLSGFDLG